MEYYDPDGMNEIQDMLAETNNADLFAVAMVMFTFIMVISIICAVLSLIAMWKIFRKMGEPGWKALIPFYSDYTLYKHIWKGFYGILIPVISVIGGLLFQGAMVNSGFPDGQAAGPSGLTIALLLGAAVIFAVALVLSIIGMIKLAKAFGKGTGFAVGLILFPLIFTLILGFGIDRYVGNPSELK